MLNQRTPLICLVTSFLAIGLFTVSACQVEDEEGPVQFFSAGETAELSFSEGSESYLVAAFSTAEAGDAIDFSIERSTSNSTASEIQEVRIGAPGSNRHQFGRAASERQRQRWLGRLRREAWTYQQRRDLAAQGAFRHLRRAMMDPADPLGVSIMALTDGCGGCGTAEVCHGSCTSNPQLEIPVMASPIETETTTMVVAKKGTVAAILVEQGLTIPTNEIDALLETFETKIYPRSLSLFGSPPLEEGGEQLAYDRNGDGLIWLVISEKPFASGSSSGEDGSVGFFSPHDFTDDSTSNQADILYIIPPDDFDNPIDTIYPILAHELQHLLSYSNKVYRRQVNDSGTGQAEALWLDEGLSHFAEDACGFGAQNVTLLDQEIVSFDQTSMFSGEDSLARRAMAMTYVRYLFEQKGSVTYGEDGSIGDAGGAAWLQGLHNSASTGTAVITETAPEQFSDFRDVFRNWTAVLALDGREITQDSRYTYDPLVADPVGSETIGVKIRGARTDFEGEEIVLEGPIENDLEEDIVEDFIPSGSVKYFRVTGLNGTAQITVQSEDPSVEFAIIALQQ